MIQPERIEDLNERDIRRGRYVLYWMQQSQRAECNHALEHAIRRANGLGLPCVALFCITQRFPEANERHYAFMLEGIRETQSTLVSRAVQLVVCLSPPVKCVAEMAEDTALVVTDRGYLRIQKDWRRRIARRLKCRMEQVESDVVVPVNTTSSKDEYAARTIRPKIQGHLERFMKPLEATPAERGSIGLVFNGLDATDVDRLLAKLRISRGARRVSALRGGYSEARRLLDEFMKCKLRSYAEGRNDPGKDLISHMSPYLHFGQISPLSVALAVKAASSTVAGSKEAYLEELVVRRELSMNLCEFNPKYDSFDGLPSWARETLMKHAGDPREITYTISELEMARTHDPYWNAAQQEMILTGKMHGYMRMYWGKKILEWVPDPREAFRIALTLNNRYELDGRDPNSFAGVAWCFGKHDRPWGERPVFGTVRCMTAAGLERKFDMDAYVRKVAALDT
jgi:deoxyribodipyrimidine photo-lyase